jgi:peptidyl-prolyl cis-trans isomerase C
MKKIMLQVVLLVVSGTGLAQSKVATVDGKPITVNDYKAAATTLGDRPDMMLSNPNLKRSFLDDLINNSLLAKKAEAAKIEETEAYKQQIKVAREQILAKLFLKSYLTEQMTEKAIEAFFAERKLNYSNREALVKHIIVKDKANAEKALAALKANPENFDQLLETYAGKNPPGHRGGSMGFVARGRLIENLEKAIFMTPKGSIHPNLVETSFGFHVVMVSDFKGTDNVSLTEVRAKVLEDMEQLLRSRLLIEQRHAAGVTIDENALKSVRF